MRGILVDFAGKRPKRDGEPVLRVSLEKAEEVPAAEDPDILALDEALSELAKFDERKARIVEMRFFGGLSVDETAEVIGVAPITVMREWNKAKAWLYLELNRNSK